MENQILVTRGKITDDVCLNSLITRYAESQPDKVALKCQNRSYTYKQFDEITTKYANYLIHKGVKKGSLVGVYLYRSERMIQTLVAIIKAGGAYVPIDPTHPVERNNYILEEAQLDFLITEDVIKDDLKCNGTVLCADNLWDEIENEDTSTDQLLQSNQQPAYVIFTSGSTGKPKGVEVMHNSMMNYLLSVSENTGLTTDVCGLSVVTITFDISISEIFLPLINGGTLVVAVDDVTKDGELLLELLEQEKINLMGFTPSTAYMLLDAGWSKADGMKLLIGGEAWNMELAEKLLGLGCSQLWNMYGPTETTIYSAMAQVHSGDSYIPIGQPIGDTVLYVLDENMQPVEKGQEGELYIGGIGVAKGYLHREDLTKERFLPDPFMNGGRIYKTGDLVKLVETGEIVYISRLDFQVKVRGYRIELGEIETALARHKKVAQAVVVLRNEQRDAILCAFVKAIDGTTLLSEELRDYLKGVLPYYMIPNTFSLVKEFPLTPNKKVDRKALMAALESEPLSENYVAPSNEIEIGIAKLWEELLGVHPVGIKDDFLELGGHSLLANRLLNRINKMFGSSVRLIELFAADLTVEEMAHTVEDNLIGSLSDEELASLLGDIEEE